MSVSAAELGRASAAVDEVFRVIAAARPAVETAARAADATDASTAALTYFNNVVAQAEAWATTWYAKVAAGWEGYPLRAWLEWGQQHARVLEKLGSLAPSTTWTGLMVAGGAAVREAAGAVVDALVPAWVWWVAGAAGVAVLLYAAAPYARALGVAK